MTDKVTMELGIHERQLVAALRGLKDDVGYDETSDYACMTLLVSRVYNDEGATRTRSAAAFLMESDPDEQPEVCAMLMKQNACGLAEIKADMEARLEDGPAYIRDAEPDYPDREVH